jgi:hypothetical protein
LKEGAASENRVRRVGRRPAGRASPLCLAVLACGVSEALAGGARVARSDDYVTLRGQYYREPSTRVVQPVVEIAKDLPDGMDLNVHYLLDAITSASAASGPSGDNIFTELRNEAGIRVGKTWPRARLIAGYGYSAESDYWSHTVVAGLALRVWQDSGTLTFSTGLAFDQVGRRVLGSAPTPPLAPGAPCSPSGARTCPLDQQFGGVSYSQVLSPTLLAQVGYEFALLEGFLASPYRAVSGQGPEVVPDKRWRNAIAARAAKYFPSVAMGLQLHYRYYFDVYPGADPLASGGDPWRVRSHSVEGRVYARVSRDAEVRLTGRYYTQGAADFWCDQSVNPSCYTGRQLYTSDPKLSHMRTEYLEAKVYWEAARWRDLAFVGWFAAGTFELSYGRYWQSSSYGRADILQAGYTIPY